MILNKTIIDGGCVLIAIRKHNLIDAGNLERTDRGKEFSCPNPACEKQVFLKYGVIPHKIPHFAHYPKQACDMKEEPESQLHIDMKNATYNLFKDHFSKKIGSNFTINKEVWVDGQRADVLIECGKNPNNKTRIAIECQVSKLGLEDFLERTRKYTEKNIYVCWLFDINPFIGHAEVRMSVVNISSWLMYFKRIYAFCPSTKSLYSITSFFRTKTIASPEPHRITFTGFCLSVNTPPTPTLAGWPEEENDLNNRNYEKYKKYHPNIPVKIAGFWDKKFW